MIDTIILSLCIILFIGVHELLRRTAIRHIKESNNADESCYYRKKFFRLRLISAIWSKNAAASDYVAKEKGRALLRAYPQLSQRDATLKICPISIEPRADLPSDTKEVYNFEVI